MQDWDRVMMMLLGGGVSVYTGYQGWRYWQQANRKAAAGAAVLSVAAVGVPLALSLLGG
ncbi:MAG TPA: hypothetical protein VD969_19855 [Symbiobacteriaceae bacterium]|nr:hypothetical protein [Symbiobacteriaceae bacterium]